MPKSVSIRQNKTTYFTIWDNITRIETSCFPLFPYLCNRKKERNIEKALKQSEYQLDRDTKEFIDFVEETKRRLKLEDDEYVKYRNLHEQAEILYRKEWKGENKKK